MYHEVHWTEKKIAQRLRLIEPLVHRQRVPLPAFRYLRLEAPLDSPPLGDVDDSAWDVVEPPTHWADWRTNFVLRTTFQVPAEWDADVPVVLHLPLSERGSFSHPEALAYIDGVPYAACDRHHQEILLPETWRDGEEVHTLTLHGWTGGYGDDRPFIRPCAVAQVDQPTRAFVATARVALGIVEDLDENDPARARLLTALDQAFKGLDTREPLGEAFYNSVPEAHAILREGIDQVGLAQNVDIVATGHAHIDVAWLWTLGQTRRKAGRTFHNVMRLMEQFPEYYFAQSQPQLYDYLHQDYPQLFEAIKAKVADQSWEPLGGMWVEADCNISGSESLARQFLLGRSFFHEHFGPESDSPVLWLPDVFGYAWNLPQLIKQAGLDYFFTIKIGWNQYNRLPYDTFWWQGLDGTRVLTHFSTTPERKGSRATYNARVTPQQVRDTWTNFQQKELPQELLMAFGYGDGGGGPTREMLENIREMAEFPSTPRIRTGRVGEFFKKLESEVGDQLPTWNGELYLELHRGTYTTQARNKRANRKSEFLLHDAEFLAAMAAQFDLNYDYPADVFQTAWRLVCLNQFHDIIPGSSIGPVYEESLQQYAEVREMGENVRDQALACLSTRVGGDVVIVNPTAFAQNALAWWPEALPSGQHLASPDGQLVKVQPTESGTLIDAGALPPYSVTPLTIIEAAEPPSEVLSVTEACLENTYVRVGFNDAGDIVSIYDKINEREVLPDGVVANQFQAFEDRPMNWDAWDIDIFYEDKMWTADPAAHVKIVETGPLRATLEIHRTLLNSEIVQRVSLTHNSARLDFDTQVTWRERHILLKVAFPVDVLTPEATYEIQWGNVTRPTHRNTSWDWARFETCAQKWVDLSEGGYGVSLLNDCKYGHDIRDNVIRLSLLRSPTMPDPEADQGEHHVRYSLLPHADGWNTSTVAEAYALNDPLIAVSGTGEAPRPTGSFVKVDAPNVVIETLKQAEDGDGVIVRLYECQRKRGHVTLTAGFELSEAWRTGLLEQNQDALPCAKHKVTFDIKPYQIVTLRLRSA